MKTEPGILGLFVVVVLSLSCVQLFATPWTAACQASLSLTTSWSLPKFMSIASVVPSSHLKLWRYLFLLTLIFPRSGTFPMSQLFTSDNPNTVASPLASVFLWSIQGLFPSRLTSLISLLSKGLSGVFSKTTVWRHQFFWCSAFFMAHLSWPYVTTGTTIALTIRTFVGRVISLFFNTLSRLVTAFLCLLLLTTEVTTGQ